MLYEILSRIYQVKFVANKNLLHFVPLPDVLVYRVYPNFNVFERLFVCQVECNNNPVCLFVKSVSQSSKSFLASSIP